MEYLFSYEVNNYNFYKNNWYRDKLLRVYVEVKGEEEFGIWIFLK